MPKRARPDDTGKVIANSDGAKLRGYLDRVRNVQKEIDKIMDRAKLDAGAYRDDLKELKREANEAGFARREFNAICRKARLEDRIEHIADGFDEDAKQRYDDMVASLGEYADTPLGRAALQAELPA